MDRLRGVARGLLCVLALAVVLPLAAIMTLFWDDDPADSYKYRNI